MSKLAAPRRRGTIVGLALLFSFHAHADDGDREPNYVLIQDAQHPELSRLLIFNDGSPESTEPILSQFEIADEKDVALAMTRHVDPRERVRGLTLLSGSDDQSVLDAAMVLLTDCDSTVREEAIQLVMQHPHGDTELAWAIGHSDPSESVRQATLELAAELTGD